MRVLLNQTRVLEDEIDKVIKDDDAIAQTLNRRSRSPTKRSEPPKSSFGGASTLSRTNGQTNGNSPLRKSPRRGDKNGSYKMSTNGGEILDSRQSYPDLRRKSNSPDREKYGHANSSIGSK